MKRVLHILKDINPPEALTVIAKQAEQPSQNISILLIQEAITLKPTVAAKIYVLKEDAQKRGVASGFKSINYSKMLELIFSSDSVVTW
ncbi:MAG: hypothetical protein HY204_11375 [Nitrospirae bacterium]|nr:hypothetical protein [Nitrospirota bacterium]